MRSFLRIIATAVLALGLVGGAGAQASDDPLLDPALRARIEMDDARYEAELADGRASRKGDEQVAEAADRKAGRARRLARIADSKAAAKGDERRAERLALEAEEADLFAAKKTGQADQAETVLAELRSAGADGRRLAKAEKKAKAARTEAALAQARGERVRKAARLASERAALRIDERAAELARAEADRAEQDAARLLTRAELRIDENAAADAWRKESVVKSIAGWPVASQVTAKWALDKYGLPEGTARGSLTWNERAPWKRIVLTRENLLTQSVAYAATPEQSGVLARMEIGVEADSGRNELSAASASEASNLLALNVADEVVHGDRTADEGREFYLKTMAMADAGKSSPYIERLMFAPRPGSDLP